MCTRTKGSKPARQLGELLQEQQEPFILDVYLAERGFVRNKLTSGADFIGCRGNSGKFLSKFGSQNQSKKSIPHFPKVLKVILCNKFCTVKGLRAKDSDDEAGRKLGYGVTEMDRKNTQEIESDRFSSASNTTVYDSCSDYNDIDEPSMFADDFKSNLTQNKVEKFLLHIIKKDYIFVTHKANRQLQMQSSNGVSWKKTVNNTALSQC